MVKIQEVYCDEGEHSPCGDVVRAGVFYFRAADGRPCDIPFWTGCRCGKGQVGLSPTRSAALQRIARILGADAPGAVLVNSDGGSYYPFE